MARVQGSYLLGELLSEHREIIQGRWVEQVHAAPGGHYRQRSPEELKEWMTRRLDALIESLSTGSPNAVIAFARRIGQERWNLGFDIGEVSRALLSLKGVVLPFIVDVSKGDPQSIAEMVAELDVCLDLEVSEFGQLFADSMRKSLDLVHEHQERVLVLEERQKLARDLHDSVAQSIFGISLHAEAVLRILPADQDERVPTYLRQIRQSALDALREMRLLIFELRPSEILEKGLEGMLRERLGAVEDRAGLETRFECVALDDLPPSVAEGLYGIAREALNNCLKHAKASAVVVRIHQDAKGLVLEIEDDGVGFNALDLNSDGGFGLQSMRDRVQRLGGRLAIRSEPGRGTCVSVHLSGDGASCTTGG